MATLNDGQFASLNAWQSGIDIKKDMKVGGSARFIGIGVTAKINLYEAVDAVSKGGLATKKLTQI